MKYKQIHLDNADYPIYVTLPFSSKGVYRTPVVYPNDAFATDISKARARIDVRIISLIIMRLPLIAYGLVASFVSVVSSTALTYKLSPNEKACFFAAVENKGAKVAFYFAVRNLR